MKKNNKLFFIDFDDTLFDTDRLKKYLVRIFEKNGVNKNEFQDSYNILRNEKDLKYNPYRQIDLINIDDINRENLLNDLNLLFEDSHDLVFSDSIDFLINIKKIGGKLVLISFGDESFQNIKIDSSGLTKYFDEIIITNKAKIDLIISRDDLDFYDEIFLLDDHPIFIDEALKVVNSKTIPLYKKINIIRINRGGRKYSNIETSFIHEEYSNLRDVFEKVC